ncbi:MAG: aminopeptidase [Bacteroidales bacterium]|nr:aminopeptidase [Bacteroidales bacterium]
MKRIIFLIASIVLININTNAQDTGYKFKMKKEIAATPVKSQYRTSTCWSFSSLSFLESELIRMGKGEFDLSEMFVVRYTYLGKADKYVRMHGNSNLAGGGAFHDVLNIIREYGIVPEEVYSGKVIGEENHIHGELDAVIKGYLDAVIKNRNRKLTPVWKKGLAGIMDAYLGKIPDKFEYNGKTYTPKTFATESGINPDDYIVLSSFTHHPFYEKFIIEIPDNWAWGECYNLPLNEFEEVLDNALKNSFSVAWGSDMSDKGFSRNFGVAVVPEKDWEEMTEEELNNVFKTPCKQKNITQELRQEGFDNFTTTDDHGMHIIGVGKDQKGNKFYKVKNSWGEYGPYDGYLYASKAYILYKSINYMIHKDAVPDSIREKLGID